MRKYLIFILLGGIIVVSSCLKGGNSSTSTCNIDVCSLKAPDSETVKIEAYLANKGITAIKHCSGLYYTVVTTGTGDSPTPCSLALVNYTLRFTTSDSVVQKSPSPAPFNLRTDVISGWTIGVPLLKRGGTIRLFIPPSLAYGPNDLRSSIDNSILIPGNSILVYDVDLLDFQ